MGKIAIYLRLSLEDADDKDESNSISNQRSMILEYIGNHADLSGCDVSEFCDDGCSGTNMDRPGMQKLLRAVKENRIGCVIVKDLSRFSRDYIELGNYMNQIFPFMGVRFIAVNDHYDSWEHRGSTLPIDTAFQTLLYDLYSKDISVKVKTSIENKLANGEYVYGQTPFGYEKSREVKNTVIINKQEAEIVRHIFDLALAGNGTLQIARILNAEKVPTKTQVRNQRRYAEGRRGQTWSGSCVRDILNNRFYLGEMAYGRSVQEHVGSRRQIAVPKEKWKVIENHHEALVTKEEYEQVCSFRTGVSTKRQREKHPLTGKLYCGGCGYSMAYKKKSGKKKHNIFYCWKHPVLQIPDCCTCISVDLLEEIVLLMLNKELMRCGDAMDQKEKLSDFQKSYISSLKKELADCGKEKSRLQVEMDELYEDYAGRKMHAGEYREKADSMKKEISLLGGKEKEIQEKLADMREEYGRLEEDMKLLIRYSHLETLTQEVVDTFIKKICVYKDKRVEIEWNFSENRT